MKAFRGRATGWSFDVRTTREVVEDRTQPGKRHEEAHGKRHFLAAKPVREQCGKRDRHVFSAKPKYDTADQYERDGGDGGTECEYSLTCGDEQREQH